MNDCIFCKIISREIPSHKVYEDDHCVAFLDNKPTVKGHTLVVPKAHYENILETPVEDLLNTMEAVKKVARAAMKAVEAVAFNIGINTGSDAGQIIFHMHIHILPRSAGDGRKLWVGEEATNEELAELAEKIKEQLTGNRD